MSEVIEYRGPEPTAEDIEELRREVEEHNTSQAVMPTGPSSAHSQEGQNSGERAKLEPPGWFVDSVKASDIEPEAIRWLWFNWLAMSKLIILAGAGGCGKTTLLVDFIATVTTGGRWPDGTQCTEQGSALIFSSEDDAGDTLVPRLIAAGAKLDRVHIIRGRVSSKGHREPFDPAKHMPLLDQFAKKLGDVRILMVDPIVNAVSGDMHRANDVRRDLQRLVDFAEQNQCAVVGITHFSKGSAGSSPAERVIGSQAFSALSRITLVAAKEEDSERRVLAKGKANITRDDGGVSYEIQPCTIRDGIETTRIQWGDIIEGSSREILKDVEYMPSGDDDGDDPVEALRRILTDGPLSSKDAGAAMTKNSFTAKQTRRARERLKVVVAREGFGADMVSYWSLPDEAQSCPDSPSYAQNPQLCPLPTVGTNGKKGHDCEESAPCSRCSGDGCAWCEGGAR